MSLTDIIIVALVAAIMGVYLTLPLLAHCRRRSFDRHVGSALDVLGQRRQHDELERRSL